MACVEVHRETRRETPRYASITGDRSSARSRPDPAACRGRHTCTQCCPASAGALICGLDPAEVLTVTPSRQPPPVTRGKPTPRPSVVSAFVSVTAIVPDAFTVNERVLCPLVRRRSTTTRSTPRWCRARRGGRIAVSTRRDERDRHQQQRAARIPNPESRVPRASWMCDPNRKVHRLAQPADVGDVRTVIGGRRQRVAQLRGQRRRGLHHPGQGCIR